jgi:hypothetical protein
MSLVGIEAPRRDLQLSFRGRRQITKFRGSKIRVKVSGERISGFWEKKLRSVGELGFRVKNVQKQTDPKRCCRF